MLRMLKVPDAVRLRCFPGNSNVTIARGPSEGSDMQLAPGSKVARNAP